MSSISRPHAISRCHVLNSHETRALGPALGRLTRQRAAPLNFFHGLILFPRIDEAGLQIATGFLSNHYQRSFITWSKVRNVSRDGLPGYIHLESLFRWMEDSLVADNRAPFRHYISVLGCGYVYNRTT
jgi:hypothetical protein